ncbi:hypothetical protein EV646_11411 [Kribbella antiqua]|uniref:Uncharacterized protein n=1 Tax=Kribbella antiqua TaxID=2512217 RepID=A0A4R2IEX9_9ACTN|nr:hypothetical protein [Kribbella antiqua]TCO42188.1 hypothetical protein EV646_11411 [Kribbella antiqua]
MKTTAGVPVGVVLVGLGLLEVAVGDGWAVVGWAVVGVEVDGAGDVGVDEDCVCFGEVC